MPQHRRSTGERILSHLSHPAYLAGSEEGRADGQDNQKDAAESPQPGPQDDRADDDLGAMIATGYMREAGNKIAGPTGPLPDADLPKRRGRPPGKKFGANVSITLEPELLRRLDDHAEQRHLTRSAVLRDLIRTQLGDD